jgi:hypothetical protein
VNTPDLPSRLDRRTALKWMLTAVASTTLAGRSLGSDASAPAAPVSGTGYGRDPDLMKDYAPGDLWPLTMSDAQRRTAAALCDVIIPAEGDTPSASQLAVHDFIDEWISAPYPPQAADRVLILEGLEWLEGESQRRFGGGFAELAAAQQTQICDEICFVPQAAPELQRPARFFARFRDLTAGGFYTTPEGMKDIGYTGNVAMGVFPGPPPEVLQKLGLA